MNEIEQRTFSGEVRADFHDNAPTHIIGYGAVFNSRSENLGGFREVILPEAFNDVLNDDVRALFNHDQNFVLGRSTAGTLSLSVDEHGLKYDITAPNTQAIRDLVLAPMQRGDINQSSFAFTIARDGDDWQEDDDGVIVRTIHRLKRLYDVSPVTYPAYQSASSTVRSLNAWKEARESGAVAKAISQKMARERLLQLLRA